VSSVCAIIYTNVELVFKLFESPKVCVTQKLNCDIS